MSDPHIEGLRKAARRTFWEAKQLEEKANTERDAALTDAYQRGLADGNKLHLDVWKVLYSIARNG